MPISKAKMRERKRLDRAVVNPKSILNDGITEYPALIKALADPIKREKLERICEKLRDTRYIDDVYYGIQGIPFGMVGEILEITK